MNFIQCSWAVYKAAQKAGLRARKYGGGVTIEVTEIATEDLVALEVATGRPLERGTEITFDDIPGRGRVAWPYVSFVEEGND